MAKKKSAARNGKQIATQTGNHYRNKHHISASPSVASSPSPRPQPHDLVQQRRRKGTPVRSPSQGDTSKGIVFSFRIQPGSDLSIDIRRYDQVSEEPAESQAGTNSPTSSSTSSQIEAAPSIASTETTAAASTSSISGSRNSSSEGREACSSGVSTQLNLAGEKWSSDPSSYLSNNIVDLTHNPFSRALKVIVDVATLNAASDDRFFKFLLLCLFVPLQLTQLTQLSDARSDNGGVQ
ncbi:hypothetical protein BGZ95_006135 [Linnemannia exigua]|uniref:Uncharacterized protein n=1 Tax=Linnemannia exigua TaxID=604196 RepID=A0AAD4DG83_9FUNG|nr:hypothetical protein BGZ95_006135 [Linnemannia exigua]